MKIHVQPPRPITSTETTDVLHDACMKLAANVAAWTSDDGSFYEDWVRAIAPAPNGTEILVHAEQAEWHDESFLADLANLLRARLSHLGFKRIGVRAEYV